MCDGIYLETRLTKTLRPNHKSTECFSYHVPYWQGSCVILQNYGANQMALHVKVIATKPVDVTSILRTHKVKPENQLSHVIHWSPHMCHGKFVN